jgi:hypothetical protein
MNNSSTATAKTCDDNAKETKAKNTHRIMVSLCTAASKQTQGIIATPQHGINRIEWN